MHVAQRATRSTFRLHPEDVSYMCRGQYRNGKNMGYVNYSIHLPDPQLLKRIKAAAEQQNISPGAFFRIAAEKAVIEHEKKCKAKRQKRAA